ncbi:MAG: complex I subunit 4 family protein [Candidatus Hermodarchaeia archaeon]|jgi:NADH-quinone oxidoreductase subunit M
MVLWENALLILIGGALFGALITYLLGRFGSMIVKGFAVTWTALLFLFTGLLWLGFNPSALGFSYVIEIPWIPTLGITFKLGVDGISFPLLLATTLLTLAAAVGSITLIKERVAMYFGTLLLLEAALIGVFVSLNLLVFFIFWELVLIPMFILIGVWGGENRRYAAMKFLIFTHVGSILMLLGFIMLFLFSGTWDLVYFLTSPIPFTIAVPIMIITFIGFAVKLPIVPLHTWLPDAHVEAPAPISIILAGVLLKMGGYGFIRITIGVFPEVSASLAPLIMTLGIITIFYGALVALNQRDMKRMVALTSINHMGLVLLGAFTLTTIGVAGAVFMMFNHACAIGMMFLLTGVIQKRAGTRSIDELSGMGKFMPWTALFFVLGSFASMGLPLFAPFVSEFIIFAGTLTVLPLLVFVILAPGIVAAYFLWTIDRIVISDPRPGTRMRRARDTELIALTLLLVPIILLGIFPAMMVDRIIPAVQILLSLGGS